MRVVRQFRNEEVRIEVGDAADGRPKLAFAVKEAVGVGGKVRQLVLRTKDEVLDLDIIADAKEVSAALRRHFSEPMRGELKVNITKNMFFSNN